MSVKMVRKNLCWVRDALYSNVSTECLLQRVSDKHDGYEYEKQRKDGEGEMG